MSTPQDHDVAAELRGIPQLAGLSEDAWGELVPLVTQRRVLAQTSLVQQGVASPAWIALVRGAAKAVRNSLTTTGESSVVLDVMRAPCVVADASIFDAGPATASVVTLRASHVFAIERRAFMRVALAHPSLARALLLQLSEDVRAHVRRIDEVVSGPVDERVKHLLESLAEQHGTPLGQGRFIAIPLRRKDIACMVNATTETVSRLLARFERDGLARSTRDGIWWRSAPRATPMPARPDSDPVLPQASTTVGLPRDRTGGRR
jgi:CRP-like cAMP-binding protein